MMVVVTMVAYDDRVAVTFHYLAWEPLHFADCSPPTRHILHLLTLLRIRPLLDAVSRIEGVQRELERQNRRDAAMPGQPRRCFKKVVDPMAFHDASTLYLGILGGALGYGTSWKRLGLPCERCGKDEWGYSCTPPALTRHGMRRDHHDGPVAFCWNCTGRSDAATLGFRDAEWPDFELF